jgi:DNA-binding MarR family transcriptional regulator
MVEIKQLNSPILREIGALSRAIHSKSDLKFKEYHLQKGQFIFLTRICENQGINHIQLSMCLKVDKTTTTKAVQKLIAGGYIQKKQDESDSRAYQLYPTAKALEVYESVIEEENTNIELCLQGFSVEEKTTIYELVKRMSRNMDIVWSRMKSERS